ncbi:hypothetical protein GA0070624_0940 [Micromonospora rhizosphaerae]|uniref:Uncharacterized protein n=1 Tax=Micromonospora rhizosphaerae TaxID=568872 RepID=A0A1C6RGB8_9ACTN|nr:hypothetical protein [Micromonospora rhizosphaerae]SCL16159.1 hypothetical protein GA0070624_0940 [Micromonospora rhizosphaerae]
MARRGWGGSVATAIGVAAGAGAAQLGFGYGLGIIDWTPADAAQVEAAWVASLAWATWISATSVVAGAVCAQRLHDRGLGDQDPDGTLRKITLAVAAAVGGLITVLLVAVPARTASVPDTFFPQSTAAGYAAVGLLFGVLVASWALRSRAAATNVVATTGWLWLLAVIAVADGVRSGRGLTSAQLGIWQISVDSGRIWIRDYFYWPGALLSVGSALVIGALAARRTARLPERRIGAAASGAAGPLLVAVAYLLAVPRLAAIATEQVSAHLIAPYAVIAGVGGSVLVAALAQRADQRAATREAGVTLPRQRTGEPDDLPTEHPRGTLDKPTAGKATGTHEPAATGRPVGGRGRAGSSGPPPAATETTEPTADSALAVAEAGEPGGSATGAATRNRSTTRPARASSTGRTEASPADEPATGAPSEATTTSQPESGTTTPPTTGPKTRPGRRSR